MTFRSNFFVMNANLILEAEASASAPIRLRANPPKRILVVEDDGTIRGLIAQALINAGFITDVAEDGAVAWDALQLNRFDLMITDNTMPKMTGVELLKKIRADRMVLPVIMATATLPAHEFAKSPWLIPDATLVKPFSIADLLEKVKAVLHANEVPDHQTGELPLF